MDLPKLSFKQVLKKLCLGRVGLQGGGGDSWICGTFLEPPGGCGMREGDGERGENWGEELGNRPGWGMGIAGQCR
jgi:hypothetical protein